MWTQNDTTTVCSCVSVPTLAAMAPVPFKAGVVPIEPTVVAGATLRAVNAGVISLMTILFAGILPVLVAVIS